MKSGRLLLYVLLMCTIQPVCIALADEPNEDAKKYILSSDVPESPAFFALGITPNIVARGGASKPIVANLVSQLQTGGKVESGVAIDFSPFFVLGGGLINIDSYRKSVWLRWVANLQASIATSQSQEDSTALRASIGARWTVIDSRDLLQNKDLGKNIDDALMRAAEARKTPTNDEITRKAVEGLSLAYADARNDSRALPGNALSIAYAYSGTFRNSVVSRDSLAESFHNVWIAYNRYKVLGLDILAMFEGIYSKSSSPIHRIGAAFRSYQSKVTFVLEVVYRPDTERPDFGFNSEIMVIPGLDILLFVGREQDNTNDGLSKIVARTSLRWNSGS